MRKRTSALTPWALSGLILAACNGDDTVTSATEGSTDTTTDTSGTTTSETTTTTTSETSTTTTTTSTSESTGDTTTTSTTSSETTTTTTGDTDTDTDTDGTTTGGVGDVDCGGEALLPPDEGLCEVTMPGTDGLLLRGTVLAPDGVYTNGQVLVVGETIACVGCNCMDDPQAVDASVVDCANG
ncbi:MAG: hypothetical protein R3A79_09185, partial [Nannocystaceae bacterium]